MRKKKKKSESIGLTCQIRLTRQTWDSCHENMITKQKKDLILMNLIFLKKRLIKKEKAKRKKYLQEGKN